MSNKIDLPVPPNVPALVSAFLDARDVLLVFNPTTTAGLEYCVVYPSTARELLRAAVFAQLWRDEAARLEDDALVAGSEHQHMHNIGDPGNTFRQLNEQSIKADINAELCAERMKVLAQ